MVQPVVVQKPVQQQSQPAKQQKPAQQTQPVKQQQQPQQRTPDPRLTQALTLPDIEQSIEVLTAFKKESILREDFQVTIMCLHYSEKCLLGYYWIHSWD